jgi:hypothetical protein
MKYEIEVSVLIARAVAATECGNRTLDATLSMGAAGILERLDRANDLAEARNDQLDRITLEGLRRETEAIERETERLVLLTNDADRDSLLAEVAEALEYAGDIGDAIKAVQHMRDTGPLAQKETL